MKKFLLTVAAATLGLSSFAASVTFDLKTSTYGITGQTAGSNANTTYVTCPATMTNGDVSVELTGDASSWRFWTDGLRIYKNKNAAFTVSVPTGSVINKIEWTVESGATFALDGTTNNITSWTGSAESVKFNSTNNSGTTALVTLKVTYDDGNGGTTDPDPIDPTPTPEGDEVVALFCVGTAGSSLDHEFKAEFKGDVVTNNPSFTAGDITINFTKNNSSASNVNGTQLRWYQNDVMNIAIANGGTITGVFINSTQGTITSTIGTLTKSGNTYSWEGNTTETLKLTASAQVRFDYLTVTYVPGKPAEVATPIIEFDLNTNTVTISCSDTNANIYYTTDGNEPTNASTKYTTSFTIDKTVTVKAIAELNGNYSYVATRECAYYGVYNNFADYIAANPTNGAKVNGPITAIYQNGINLYTKDNDGGFMLIYGTAPEVENGDQFAYVSGKYSPYNGLPEISSPEFGEITTGGEEVEPVLTTLPEVKDATLNSYIQINGVEIAAATANRTYTMTDVDGNTATLYNTFYNSIEVPAEEDTYYDVVGFVGTYNGNIQITPISIITSDFNGIANLGNVEVAPEMFYNLQGVKVNNPVKGQIYIVNGKKVVF